MKKSLFKWSLFSRIFFTQILIAVLVMVIIIPTMFVLIGEYFVRTQKDSILDDAESMAVLSGKIADMDNSQNAWLIYQMGIEYVSRQSSVLVINADGEVIAAPKNLTGIDISKVNKKFIEPVLSGEKIVRLYGSGNIFSQQTIVAMVPVVKRDNLSGKRKVLGVAVALRTMPQIRYIQYKIVKIVVCSQMIAWVLAFIISYFLTKHITKPIKKMQLAAKSIASGNFNERIEECSTDEIGELAQSFNMMTESLAELEKMRSTFISDVSHELRTPMTIISGFVEGIVDGTIPKEQEGKYLEIVLSETKRLTKMVRELLEASRLEQGKIKIEKTNIDMNRLVTESIITYEQRLTEKKISVNLILEGEKCYAFADKDSIKRVLINLIDNAIKFTPCEGKITIKTQYRDKKVYTTVENTGQGIKKEELKHIWERFYKTDKSRSVDKTGVGLGLHIVKTIISQHNGDIYAESNEGEFARFVFVLDEGKGIDKDIKKYDNFKRDEK